MKDLITEEIFVNKINAMKDQLFESLSHESDRGLILISSSFLDEALELLLRAKFKFINNKPKKLIDSFFNSDGPLSTFNHKIKMAYAMDIISKWEYQDLEIIRKIRNAFAHTFGAASFSSEKVVKLTETLVGADFAIKSIGKSTIKQKKAKIMKQNESIKPIDNKAKMERMRVTMTVSYMGGLLSARNIIFASPSSKHMKDQILTSLNSSFT